MSITTIKRDDPGNYERITTCNYVVMEIVRSALLIMTLGYLYAENYKKMKFNPSQLRQKDCKH